MAGSQPTLETERLVLRPFVVGDAPEVKRLAGDHEIASMTIHIPHPYPDGAAESWIATHPGIFEAGRGAVFAITSREDQRLVGAIDLSFDLTHARGELGYWIGRTDWGQGFATEAARAVVAFGFGTVALHRIQAVRVVRNAASGRVLEKLGMQREGVHRAYFRRDGRFEDVVMHAILRPDWAG